METCRLIKPLLDQKHLQLNLNLANDVVVIADATKVKEILNNLLGNAIKFTNQGSISVSTYVNGKLLIINVQDSGIGIRPEDQTKLFQKFQQISSELAGRPIGTGLGLYISREFARKMGGDLRLSQSVVGVGSTFSLSLPLSNSVAKVV